MTEQTFEFITSVLTPDCGQVLTIIISKEKLDLPFTDKSVAIRFEESPHAVFFTYGNGDVVIVPYTNVRYIYIAAETKDKKETPHTFDPFKKKKT